MLYLVFNIFSFLYFPVVVDYAENPNANTGLFMKIVPERRTPTKILQRTGQDKTQLFTAPKVPRSTADVNHHRQWVENVNNKLAAMRFTINDRQESPINQYLGYNRGNMLVPTALSLADVNDETVINTETKNLDVDTEKDFRNDAQPTPNTDRRRSSNRPSGQSKRRRMID